MNDSRLSEILSLDCESRYEVFLDLVVESREAWILVNEDKQFLKIHDQDNDFEYLPIWPHADFAHAYAADAVEKLSPKEISIPEFFSKWVAGLEGDGLDVGVFPKSGSDVWVMSPSELKADLQEALSSAFPG